jgi:hypothetical protein
MNKNRIANQLTLVFVSFNAPSTLLPSRLSRGALGKTMSWQVGAEPAIER